MKPRDPIAQLPTHEVLNMPPYMGDQDLWADDRALRHWAIAHWAVPIMPGILRKSGV